MSERLSEVFGKIAALSFDLDDTLWPIRPAIERAEADLQAWLADRHPQAAPRLTREVLNRHRDDVAASRPDLAHDLSEQRRLALESAFVAAQLDAAHAEPAFAHFWRGRNRVDLFADVRPALAFLADRYRLATLSNGNACVDTIGIGEYFAIRVTAREFGRMKPDRLIFQHTAEALRLAPQRILHIGDDPEADVQGARAAGFRSCWINRGDRAWPRELPPPDLECSSLDQLCAALTATVS